VRKFAVKITEKRENEGLNEPVFWFEGDIRSVDGGKDRGRLTLYGSRDGTCFEVGKEYYVVVGTADEVNLHAR
jgi:hypothetical protein